MNLTDCEFCKLIVSKSPEIIADQPSFIIIKDKNPDAKVHLLAVPKNHFENIYDAQNSDFKTIANIIEYVSKNAKMLGLADGCRLVINNGPQATQTLFHAHVHILGGQQLKHMEKN